MDLPQRKRPAHGVHIDPGGPNLVFLTACTNRRKPWLACPEAHDALRNAWVRANAWSVGRYVFMPDHLHLFCAPRDLEMALDNWVRFWKSLFRKSIGHDEWRFQSGHWDTRLRRSENYDSKWEYVRQNPVRAGLVRHQDDWPYQGELHHLPW